MGKQRFVSTGKPATLAISQTTAIALSTILWLSAVYAPVAHYLRGIPEIERQMNSMLDDGPALLSMRDPAMNGEFFDKRRYDDMPIQYGLLHIIPAIVWSITIPILLSDSFRAKYPAVHRFLGYVTAALHAVLIVSGIGFPIRKFWEQRPLTYSHVNPFHVHKLKIRGYTVLAWGTFDAGLPLLLVHQAYTLYRTIKAARAHRYAEHRTWAIMTVMAGYVIALFRVGLIITRTAGAIYQYVLPSWLIKELGWELAAGKETWNAEMSTMAWAVWFAFACVAIWWKRNDQVAVFDQTTFGKRAVE